MHNGAYGYKNSTLKSYIARGTVNRAADALSRLYSDAVEPKELYDDIPTLPVIAFHRTARNMAESCQILPNNQREDMAPAASGTPRTTRLMTTKVFFRRRATS